MDLTITADHTTPGRHLLRLTGALDLQSRNAVLEVARAGMSLPGMREIALDMAGVTFMDSTGIGALIEVAGVAADADLGFVVFEPSSRVERILQVTGLYDAWTIEKSS